MQFDATLSKSLMRRSLIFEITFKFPILLAPPKKERLKLGPFVGLSFCYLGYAKSICWMHFDEIKTEGETGIHG